MKHFHLVMCFLLLALVNIGCTSSPPPQTGFLSDYSKLTKEGDSTMRYTSPDLKHYNKFHLETVNMSGAKKLSDKEKQEVADYFTETLRKDLIKRGYQLGVAPGNGVGRIRIAITDIKESKWYLSLHPASKLTGAGTGGASMEAEVVDGGSGEQLAAVIQAGRGNQFELDAFSKLDDVKDAINKWVETAGNRLDAMRKGS